jgi:serine/threonine-protein kinase
MDLALERRAMEAFEEAMDWPAEGRARRAVEAWGDDPQLLAAVQALLRAQEAAAVLPTAPPQPAAPAAEAPPPERIGPYRLTTLIGRGGMGSVWRAERDDGLFDQSVAIKLIRSGLFSAAAAEQFTLERKILARLRHPHIAQLFDGGVTEQGVSYIVMELIAGEPITVYARERGLSLSERVVLFLDACEAIQYAHQQLVAHADIKPSNLVVDERYGVKLLDFGISRLLEEATEADDAGDSPGAHTPAYASPQVLRGERATSADDVYALGGLLAELAGDAADGDLAAVAAKARARQPADRYVSASALAADLRRWLDGYPVAARPVGRLGAAISFWRRHRLGVSLAAAAVAGLIATAVVTTGLYVRAEAERRAAEARFDEVRALSRFMLHDVTDSLERFPGAAPLRRDLADRARRYLEGLSRVPGASRELRLETAEGYAKTGEILGRASGQNLGDPVDAKAALARAEAALRALLADRPGDARSRLALARTLLVRATIASTSDNDKRGALVLLGEACALADQAGAAGLAGAAMTRWDCDLARASVLSDEARFAEMAALMQQTLARGAAVTAAQDPQDLKPIYQASALNLLGDAQFYLGRKAEALEAYKSAAAVLEAARARRADIRVFDKLALSDYNIASTLSDLHRAAEALPWIDRGVAVVDQMRAFEDSPRARHVESIVRLQRAVNLGELGRWREAIAEGEADVARRRAKALAAPRDYEGMRAYAVGLRPMGELYWAAGRKAEACATWRLNRRTWDELAAGGGLMGFDRTDELHVLEALLAKCG